MRPNWPKPASLAQKQNVQLKEFSSFIVLISSKGIPF